ncbi:MAG: hypothetical protein O7J95_21890 [Planctomycetota bacterium]|nr:hypothetical protein [Planctomycetota bacterium]
MPQRLRHLFGREIQLLTKLLGPARRLRTMLGRRTSRQAARPPRRQGDPRSGSEGRSSRRVWRLRERIPSGLRGLVGSLALHALVLLGLFRLLPEPPMDPGPAEPTVVQIRLRPRPRPPPEPPKPEPLAPEVPLPPEPREEAPSPLETPVAPPLGEEPEVPADARPAEFPPPSRPSVVGLGLAPPPLDFDGFDPTRGERGLYASRFDGKFEALETYGGSGATENAVEKGLAWLAAHQDASGGWRARAYTLHCKDYRPCPGAGQEEFDIGVTSLALLAFLGAGHTPDLAGPYRRHVGKALQYLKDQQDGAGVLGRAGDHYFYNHALATFALSEGYALTRRKAFRDCVEAALRYSWQHQQPIGGWDYTARASGRNDLSITGWQTMAIRSAENAGIEVPRDLKNRLRAYLNRAFTPRGYGIYANRGTEAGRRGANMVAVGLLSHLYTGGLPTSKRCRLAADRLVIAHPPDWKKTGDWSNTFQSYYYWYAATLCLFHLGGPRWEAWNHLLQKSLLPLQATSPHEEGSWPPEPNWIGYSGGRVYATAINVLTLEVYYRYKPLFGTRRR